MNSLLDGRAFVTPSVLCKDLGDEAILLDLTTETYFGLNAAGSRLWKLLTTSPTIRDAFEVMLEEYDVVPEELLRDMTALITDLVDRGLLKTENA
jgi:Coenzyme PQQ synthesis protein D (PqqD)